MKLIVGLGNPGRRYARTRHNVGWRVAEELAGRADAGSWKEKFDAAVAETRWHGQKVILARPLTFMNRSGEAVRQMVCFWQPEREDLLVVGDDMWLDLGRIRLRTHGSDGGHNGLASVIAHLGDGWFPRLRVGVGPAPSLQEHTAFVLSPLPEDQRQTLAEAIVRAADAAERWITEGIDEAMNRFNRARES